MDKNLSETPIARPSDPISSHIAADDITRNGTRGEQQKLAAQAVKDNPGKTSLELSTVSNLDRYQLARRLPEIEGLYVEKGPIRRCTKSGRPAVTWYPVKKERG